MWLDPRTKLLASYGKGFAYRAESSNNPDITWLQDRTSALAK